MIVAIIITIALLGIVWTYGIPLLQGAVPAQFTQNKWMQLAVTGGFLLLTVFVVGLVVKATGVKDVASA